MKFSKKGRRTIGGPGRPRFAQCANAFGRIDRAPPVEVAGELAQVRAKIAELGERKIAAEDLSKRMDIRAPQDGVVHQSQVHTVGGVIAPGQVIMLIVPETDALTVQARVSPSDIDQLHMEQDATLRFSAFNQRTTPELHGEITHISADLTEDERTHQGHYVVRIAIADAEIARLEGLKLVPGMPAEAFIQTSERSVLSYLLKPLMDQAMRTFRES